MSHSDETRRLAKTREGDVWQTSVATVLETSPNPPAINTQQHSHQATREDVTTRTKNQEMQRTFTHIIEVYGYVHWEASSIASNTLTKTPRDGSSFCAYLYAASRTCVLIHQHEPKRRKEKETEKEKEKEIGKEILVTIPKKIHKIRTCLICIRRTRGSLYTYAAIKPIGCIPMVAWRRRRRRSRPTTLYLAEYAARGVPTVTSSL